MLTKSRILAGFTAAITFMVVSGCTDFPTPPDVTIGVTIVPGDVYLESQTDVDLMAGVQEILGSLTIGYDFSNFGIAGEGEYIVDLSPLHSLRKIGNSLTINHNLELQSLAGLQGLEEINGSLYFRDNPMLTSISVLGHIRGITRLGIVEMLLLDDVGQWCCTAEIEEILIADCPLIEQLNGLLNMTVCNRLSVNNCDGLVDLTGDRKSVV